MPFIENFICECPEETLEDYTIPQKRSSPVDSLGLRYKCCGCISLKTASILICIITLIWAALQLQGVDTFIGHIFPDKEEDAFYYTKMFYLLMCVLMILACGVLMLGIFVEKSDIVNVFVWYGFIFNCAYIGLTIAGTVITVLSTGDMPKKQIWHLIGAVMWSCLFFYLLMVVNSYRTFLWL